MKTDSLDPDFHSRRGSAQSAGTPIGYKGATGKGDKARLFDSFMTEDADAIADRTRVETAGSGSVQNAMHDGSTLGGEERPTSVKGRAEI